MSVQSKYDLQVKPNQELYFHQLLTEKKVKLQLLLSIPWMNKKFRCNVPLTQSVLKFTKLPKMANPISLKAWKMGPTSASEIPEINGNLNEWLTEKKRMNDTSQIWIFLGQTAACRVETCHTEWCWNITLNRSFVVCDWQKILHF